MKDEKSNQETKSKKVIIPSSKFFIPGGLMKRLKSKSKPIRNFPVSASLPGTSERPTPEGEDFMLSKSISESDLTESWKSAENVLKSSESLKDKVVSERGKSLENLKKMPAYGDLILDCTPPVTKAGEKKDHLYKILVIGDLGAGKTSIIKRYVHRFFTQHYRATIGVDFALKVLNWDENTLVRLQLWDIAGQERYGNMTRVYYKEAVGAFIVFDVTRVTTFESVAKWKQDLDSKVQLSDGSPIPCVLLANKCDQPKEGIVNNHNKMDEYCKENGFTAWFETSAKDNINIDEAAKALVTKILEDDAILNADRDNRDNEKLTLKSGDYQKSSKCPC